MALPIPLVRNAAFSHEFSRTIVCLPSCDDPPGIASIPLTPMRLRVCVQVLVFLLIVPAPRCVRCARDASIRSFA